MEHMNVAGKVNDAVTKEFELKKELGTMDRILVILGVFLFFFIVTMIITFYVKDSTPDTLIMGVFGACAVEGGLMGWIKTRKDKIRARIEELRGKEDAG